MKAYKVFNPDWTCRGFQYEVGKTFEMNDSPKLCETGFHACKNIADCFNYYSFNPENKVAEVELIGDIVGQDEEKQATNRIKIVKELTWHEVLVLANTGKGCTGLGNSGDYNSGDRNSGNMNSGDRNSGDRNSGDYNSGDRNSGYWNSGDYNSGDYNSGDRNSGDRNSGDRNSGNMNSGDWNSGDRNSGNMNSGDYNSGNRNSGFFNSKTPDDILVFNKPCSLKVWENAEKPQFIYDIILNEWISFDAMTDEEKIQYPNAFVCYGYLKKFEYKEAWQNAYKSAFTNDIELLKALPNFDAKVFEEITGIVVK